MPRRSADRRRSALRRLLLVVVTDRRRCRGDLLESCEAAVRGGATAVLLRDKDLPRRERRRLARRLRSITVRYNAALFVHTDAALAREVDADGVHLDSAAGRAEIATARRLVGRSRLVGVSTHSGDEVRRAAASGADYAFLGPIWPTRSHLGRKALGPAAFGRAERSVRIPVLPIGGVGPLRSVRRAAVVDAVLGARDPTGAAGAMVARLAREPGMHRAYVGTDERTLVAGFLRKMGRVPGLRLGPGDDAVVLRAGGVAVATDLTVEATHYERGTAAGAVGFKAAGRALSDLAAVGARPFGLMVGLVLRTGPGALDRARRIEAGAAWAARAVGACILGGDTKATGTEGREMVSVTALGFVEGRPPLPRSGARPGDILFVTGPLGGAFGAPGLTRHLRPRPRIAIGLELRRRGLATACVDISDGLSRDLRRICEPSRVGAILEGARVPIHRDERRFRKEGRLLRAISGGEEYELLFAAPPEKARQLEGRGVAGRRVFRIGRVVDRAAGVVVQGESTLLEALPDSGYIHFKHVPVEPHLPRRSR